MNKSNLKNTKLYKKMSVDNNKTIKVEELNEVEPVVPSSHNMNGSYAVLMETNGEEMESWYYFIKVEGNEESLKYLQSQLEQVEWYILDDLSTFDLDLDHYVSAQTAKEMTKVDLNHCSFHRKFDGKLQKIDLGFSKKDKNKKKIKKTFDILGYGLIEDFIDDEDVDEEDLVSGSNSESSYSEDTDDESVSSSESEDSRYRNRGDRNKKYEVPPSVLRNRLKDKIAEEKDKRKRGGRKHDDRD
jgi:hypothetical protein